MKIRKVLIAEDHQSASLSLQKTLSELNIIDVDIVYYCDDAVLKIEKNKSENSFDLLVTDLHFEKDNCPQNITRGASLITEARKIQPELKILVFSAEGNTNVIKTLFDTHKIDGYVRKARHDAEELKTAIIQISQDNIHLPIELSQSIRRQHSYKFTDYDITLISLLANGTLQKNIPHYLQQNNIRPYGLSSIEKQLKLIRDTLQINKNEQLVMFCKEMGII
jgi:two-component system capsular synthesis response regulator RcsB